MEYKTKQRELILGYLRERGECASAEDIINDLTQKGQKVAKTTVYRTLDRFVGEGSISRYVGTQGSVYRYTEGHCDHFHLKCTECGKTVCADCVFINRMQTHFLEHHGFEVSKNQTVIYGICKNCRENNA